MRSSERGQDPEVLARRVHHPDLGVAREVEAAGAPLDGELLPVGRVARRVVVRVVRRQPRRLAAVGGNDVDVALELDVPVLVPRRGERDALAVGRPGGVRVLEVAVGDLLRLGRAVCGHDVEVPAPVARPADRVELVEEPREPARSALLVVLLLVRLVGDARGEDDLRPVRRPGRLADVVLQVGEALRLAAAHRHDIQLPARLLVAALGDEGEPRRRRATSVAGRRCCRSSAGAAVPEPSVGASQIDWRYSFSSPSIDQTTYATSSPPGAQPGVTDPRELVDVLGPHPCHGAKLSHGRF